MREISSWIIRQFIFLIWFSNFLIRLNISIIFALTWIVAFRNVLFWLLIRSFIFNIFSSKTLIFSSFARTKIAASRVSSFVILVFKRKIVSKIILIKFFKTTTRFIISCETWTDCEWNVERKYEKDEYEKDEYEKDEYEKNEYEKNIVDADVIDVDVVDDDVVDVDDVNDANDVDDVDDANDVNDIDDVDVDVDSTIIENKKKKRRARKRTRDLIDRKKDWKMRTLLIHWSKDAC